MKEKIKSKQSKPFYKKWWFIAIIVFFAIGILGSATGVLTIEDDAPAQEKSEEVKAPKATENTKVEEKSPDSWKTEAEWAELDKGYAFAIGIEDYSGDIFEPGTYKFYPNNVDIVEPGEMLADYTQQIWDIYVSNKLYDRLTDIPESELVTSIGGIDQASEKLELKKGQYVYVSVIDVVGKSLGTLKIEKV